MDTTSIPFLHYAKIHLLLTVSNPLWLMLKNDGLTKEQGERSNPKDYVYLLKKSELADYYTVAKRELRERQKEFTNAHFTRLTYQEGFLKKFLSICILDY